MFVVVRNLDGNVIDNYHFQPEYYTWSILGGPETALVKVAGTPQELHSCLNMLRFEVEIYTEQLQLVWWGYVNKVVVQDDATRITQSLQGFANTVGVLYVDGEGQERFSGWKQNLRTQQHNRYGNKQLLLDVSSTSGQDDISDDSLLKILEPFENIPPTLETSRQDSTGATLECVGWATTLEWQNVPFEKRGKYGDITNYKSDASLYNGVSGFKIGNIGFEKRIAQFADFTMNDYEDKGFESQYISRVLFYMRFAPGLADDPTAYLYEDDGINMEIWSTDGSNPSKGQMIGKPVRQINTGAYVSSKELRSSLNSGGSFSSLEFRWPTASFELPKQGWFFVMKTNSSILQLIQTERSYWRSGSSNRNNNYIYEKYTTGSRKDWGRYELLNYTNLSWLQFPFEFYTRLSAFDLVTYIIQEHSIISSTPYPSYAPIDEKFDLFLDGRQTMLSLINNVCNVDQLFYVITPNKVIKLYEAPKEPELTNIVMKADGTLNIDTRGDISRLIGKWIYNSDARGVHGLCTSVRYEVRTGAYDLSFRGAPSLSEVSTRILR